MLSNWRVAFFFSLANTPSLAQVQLICSLKIPIFCLLPTLISGFVLFATFHVALMVSTTLCWHQQASHFNGRVLSRTFDAVGN